MKNIRYKAVSVLFTSLLLLGSICLSTSISVSALQNTMTFTTGDTINFSSINETTFWSNTTMRFGTGIRIRFVEVVQNGYLEVCDYIQIIWPLGFQAEPCSWWEILDPLGNPTGFEFHIDGQTGPYEFHVDQIYPAVIPIPLPPQPVTAEKKIEHVSLCDFFVVHWPIAWYPSECSWWEIMDPETGLPTGFEFHVDWNNQSCEFHVDKVYPHEYMAPFPGVYELEARQKITEIRACNWFVVLDPAGLVPSPCSWWDVWRNGAPYGGRFHVDSVVGRAFHVDQTVPNPIDLSVSPEYPTVARQVMLSLASCQWCKVDDLAKTPKTGTWWHLNTGLLDVEFYVDQSYAENGTFHIGTVLPNDPMPFLQGQEPSYVTAEKKFVGLGPCDWFQVTNPQAWLPEPCSWWKITWPTQWASVSFHVDSTDGISKFHIDAADPLPLGPTPPPWNVTAIRAQPPSGPWYVKQAYPDYAPSGMPDFDEKQDNWGPGQGIYTWCVPVAVANSLWWLDSKYESMMFPDPEAPPTVSDHFNLVNSSGQWDDHDPNNVAGLVANLALLMDTDGIRTHDGHTGTRWTDVQNAIKTYLVQQGVAGMFEVHNSSFPTFAWIQNETEVCQDVELFLEFWQWDGLSWTNETVTNPSLELGHCVTVAGVNGTASQILISDPWQDAYETGMVPGRSPVPHVYPHNSAFHNDAQYVSQDAYPVAAWNMPPPSPYGSKPIYELVGYMQTLGFDPSYHAFIRAAVATSPTGIHDIAVTNVTTAKDGCNPLPTVPQDGSTRIRVTVLNQGDFVESFFNVTVYANGTEVAKATVASLNVGEQTILNFTWSTVGFAKGHYAIKANATIVSGETDILDNTFTGSTLYVVIPGDINGDKTVDIFDAIILGGSFGSAPGNANWTPNADFNDDMTIDIFDAITLAGNFGQSES